jgi:negative regulator of flagellin synthesis FlgM
VKIESAIKSLAGPPGGDVKARSPQGSSNAADAAAAKVQLSSLSSSLQKAETAMAAEPAVNSSRVAEIRQAIAEGRFKVDAGRIADGLLESVREMLAERPESS